MALCNSKRPNSEAEEPDPAGAEFRPYLPSVMITTQSYPNGERTGKELSLVIGHGINCFVRFLDLFSLSGLSDYDKTK
jgi:hypothetical protein